MDGSRTAAIVGGIILLVLGLLTSLGAAGILIGGIATAAVGGLRNDEGFLVSPERTFTTDSYAITTERDDPMSIGGDVRALPFDLATLRVTATSQSGAVFIGVARQDDIDAYLDGVQHSELHELRGAPFDVEYREVPGTAPSSPPEEEEIWVTSASGTGPQHIDWPLTTGDWGIVVMNADASMGIEVDLSAGVRSDLLGPATAGMLAAGGIGLLWSLGAIVAGSVLLAVGARRQPAVSPAPAAPPTAPS